MFVLTCFVRGPSNTVASEMTLDKILMYALLLDFVCTIVMVRPRKSEMSRSAHEERLAQSQLQEAEPLLAEDLLIEI